MHEKTTAATPYAGITQIRFKGYLLSLNSAPLALTRLFPTPNLFLNQVDFFPSRAKRRRAFSSVALSSSPAAMPRISAKWRAVSTT